VGVLCHFHDPSFQATNEATWHFRRGTANRVFLSPKQVLRTILSDRIQKRCNIYIIQLKLSAIFLCPWPACIFKVGAPPLETSAYSWTVRILIPTYLHCCKLKMKTFAGTCWESRVHAKGGVVLKILKTQKGRRRERVKVSPTALSDTSMGFSDGFVEQLSTIEEYNKRMAERMGWQQLENPYEYRPERGLYYHYITEDIVVGSQPRSGSDIEQLSASEGVRAILNLQQDRDLAHWGVDIEDLKYAANKQGITIIRTPAVDFDPHSLRATLPSAVAALQRARMALGRVYVHCTAGLGRSPAVAIASLYWFHGLNLDDAYAHVTGIRPCGPNKDAIRGATYDLLSNGHWDGFHQTPHHAWTRLDEAQRQQIQEKLGF
jgi:protein-tyrosine phosphatase